MKIQQDTGHQPPEDFLESLLTERAFLQHPNATPLRKLRRNLQVGIGYAHIITLFYAYLIYYFPIWQVQTGLLLVMAFNFWVLYQSLNLLKTIDAYDAGGHVLPTLKTVRDSFRNWFRQQYQLAIVVYPIAAAAGFMLGGTVGSGKPVEAFMGKPGILIALVIVIIILVPLGFLLARWLNQKAYGRYVDQLEETIRSLEREEEWPNDLEHATDFPGEPN